MAETFFYMTTIGRITGNAHKIEIWFVEHDGCYYLCNGGGKADWVKNIQQNPDVKYYAAQGKNVTPEREYEGIAQVVTDDSIHDVVKALFDAKYKWSNGLLVQICPKP